MEYSSKMAAMRFEQSCSFESTVQWKLSFKLLQWKVLDCSSKLLSSLKFQFDFQCSFLCSSSLGLPTWLLATPAIQNLGCWEKIILPCQCQQKPKDSSPGGSSFSIMVSAPWRPILGYQSDIWFAADLTRILWCSPTCLQYLQAPHFSCTAPRVFFQKSGRMTFYADSRASQFFPYQFSNPPTDRSPQLTLSFHKSDLAKKLVP